MLLVKRHCEHVWHLQQHVVLHELVKGCQSHVKNTPMLARSAEVLLLVKSKLTETVTMNSRVSTECQVIKNRRRNN